MRVIAIGRAGANASESALFARYAARIKLGLVELPDGHGSPGEIKRREAEAILSAVSPAEFLVALDTGGITPDSLELATLLTKWTESSKKLAFIIGGAEGLDATVIARANAILSLGRLTWPHQLARAMLAEQLYRARMISTGHPYHRAGRP
jgi:23S rRNA (pseudouridine1915-N3)-methyltransferase